jgi:uncharacterized protein (TIGR03067 family)
MMLTAIGCRGPEEQATRLKAMQGSWNVISLIDKSGKADADQLKRLEIVFAKDKMQILKDNKVAEDFNVRADNTKTPKEMDLVSMAGADQGNSHLGIFEWQGDVLKICTAAIGKGRPTEFTAKAGTTWIVYELKRKN